MRHRWNARADVVYGSTDVVCNQDRRELNNSLGQNPCLVYAYMVGSCASIFVQVEILNQSAAYPPPSGDLTLGIRSASQCTCGRVPYNLISACSFCQGKSILPYEFSLLWYPAPLLGTYGVNRWSTYNASCGDFVGKHNFSSNVPPGSALPKWATRQTNVTSFVWDAALLDKDAGEFTASNSSTTTSTSQSSQTPTGTGIIRRPHAQEFELGVTAGVALSALAVCFSFFVIAAFLHLWRRIPKTGTKGDKVPAIKSARASTIVHSVLFSAVIIISIVNACTTTWTSIGLTVGGVVGLDSLRSLLNFLVFTSWWTFVGSVFFLLAFLYDRTNRDHDGTFTAKRFGTLHGHLIWLVLTWCLWVLGASLFAATVAQVGECQLHCTQLRVIPGFAFIELIAISLILVVVIFSYWSAYRRSRPPKRLGRSQSQRSNRRKDSFQSPLN